MRIIIILFAVVLVVFKSSGASPNQWEENSGQATVIMPATPWNNIYPGEIIIAGGQQAGQSVPSKTSIRPSKKKWYPKRWIFRPPMEPN